MTYTEFVGLKPGETLRGKQSGEIFLVTKNEEYLDVHYVDVLVLNTAMVRELIRYDMVEKRYDIEYV